MKSRLANAALIILFIAIAYIPSISEKKLSDRAEAIKANVVFLSSDDLEGRLPGTPGNQKAADYILNQFRMIGLLPINGVSTQEFKINNKIKVTEKTNVTFTKIVEKAGLPPEMWTKADRKWNPGTDYYPVSISENATVSGEVAFVGYGISAKELSYDDYEGIDVKGKIVIIFSDSLDGKPHQAKFENYANLKYKASNARDHGAIGVIFIKRLSDSANVFYRLKIERISGNSGMVAIQANRTELAKFFPKDKNLYPIEMEMLKSGKPKSFVLPSTKLTMTVDLEFEQASVNNIIGEVKGTDPALADEYIVIGAHYDHIGGGEFNSNYKGKTPQIHNGADDNASGTSALIELARKIKLNPLNRNVVFVAFNCEEMGVLGSSYFVKNPVVPSEKIALMVNLDMVGRLKDNKITVFGVNSAALLDKLIDSLGIADTVTVIKNAEGYGPSDHASFYNQKIPVLFMFTGVHLDYHTPSDDWDKINFEGMAKVCDFTEGAVRAVDSYKVKPEFAGVITPPTDQPEKRSDKPKVWFGAIPDFAENPKGFVINGCSPGSPAEKAGLKAGDIITQIGENTIKNLGDFSRALKEHSPGDKVKVSFIRDGKVEVKEVELAKKGN